MLLIYYPNQTDQRAWSSLDWPALPRISYFNPSEAKPISSRGLTEYCWCSKAPGFDSGSTVMLFSSPFFPWSFKQSVEGELSGKNAIRGMVSLGSSAGNCHHNDRSTPTRPQRLMKQISGNKGFSSFPLELHQYKVWANLQPSRFYWF